MNMRVTIVEITLGGVLVWVVLGLTALPAVAYPPAVGILSQSGNCLSCHANNGPWKDDGSVIVDILDRASGRSLRLPDGSFLIEARRGEARTVLTVIGTAKEPEGPTPHRNAWLYVDVRRIKEPSSLNKFAPGWAVSLPMACRLVGDPSDAYPEAHLTVLPMTVRPGDHAPDAEVQLQVMLTTGESVKGKAREGMVGSYFERKVLMKVTEEPEAAR